MNSAKFRSMGVLVLLCTAFEVHANWLEPRMGWMKEEDAAAHFESVTTNIHIKKDYSEEAIYDATLVIDKKEAISSVSIIEEAYDSSVSQVKLLAAETVNRGKTYKVSPQVVEDVAIAADNGFANLRQLRFAMPQLEVGAKIHYKILKKSKPRVFSDFYGQSVDLFEVFPVRSLKVQVDSDVRLLSKLHDPLHLFKVSEGRTKTGSRLEAQSTGTIFRMLQNDPSAFDEPQQPSLYLSTLDSWSEFGEKMTPIFESVVKEPLPPEFEAIVNQAKAKTLPEEQVELVQAKIHELVHYVASWKRNFGGYAPRHLKEIALTHFGDCKDYAVATTAILRKLGFEANTVLVNARTHAEGAERGGGVIVGYMPPLPGHLFNHVIAKVKVGQKELWIDPTVDLPFARGQSPMLTGSYTLLMKPGASKMEVIPMVAGNEEKDQVIFNTVNADNTLTIIRRIKVKGMAAAAMRASGRFNAQNFEAILESTTRDGPKSTASQGDLDESRYDQTLNTPPSDRFPGAACGLMAPESFVPYLKWPGVGGLFLHYSMNEKITQTFEGGVLIGEPPKSCSTETPWFSANRKVSTEDGFLRITDTFVTKKTFVTPAELQSQQMTAARQDYETCWKTVPLVFTPDSFVDPKRKFNAVEPWTIGLMDRTLQQVKKALPSSVRSAVESKDKKKVYRYASVVPEWTKGKSRDELVKKASTMIANFEGGDLGQTLAKHLLLEASSGRPADPEILGWLGRAEMTMGYINGENFEPKALDRAKGLIYTALEIDPLNIAANHALTKWLLNSHQDKKDIIAEAQFTLELDPSSKVSVELLAKAFMRAGANEKAEALLKGSDNYKLLQDLYVDLKKFDQAEAVFQLELKKDPSAWAYNNYAAFLIDRGKYDLAIENLKKALELKEFGMAHHNLGRAYLFKAAGLIDNRATRAESRALVEKALAEDSRSHYAHYVKGKLAIADVRDMSDSDPEGLPTVKRALDELNQASNMYPGYALYEIEVMNAKNELNRFTRAPASAPKVSR